MIDAVVQSSTVGLFHSLAVAVAPLPVKTAIGTPWTLDWAGFAEFDAPWMHGSLALTVPSELCRKLRYNGTRAASTSELLRELTHQLLRRIENRLAPSGVSFRTGLPVVIDRPALVRRTAGAPLMLYPFRTVCGEVTVTLHGQLEA
ncbi:MAG TPA: hypothetical protein VM686_12855 [Polyangiaceae bacterium]|jgi:hypothetical protein|nr:hypothetical protein [Polyangiaceae bacterium]